MPPIGTARRNLPMSGVSLVFVPCRTAPSMSQWELRSLPLAVAYWLAGP
jgi:hypothetical protein